MQKKEIEKLEQKKDESKVEFKCYLATPFDIIIKDIIDKITYATTDFQNKKVILLQLIKKKKYK